MANISQIPTINNLEFVQENVTLPTQYHHLHMGEDWYKSLGRTWQYTPLYKQKIQQSDKQYLTVARSGTDEVYFKIFDECGNVIDITSLGSADSEVDPDCIIYDTGAVYTDENGGETPLVVHMWSFRFSDFNLDDGTYYLRLYFNYYDSMVLSETKTWVTEPLSIRADHPDTILIEATNDTNRQDAIFSYESTDPTNISGQFFKPVFGHRVEGDIIEYVFDSNNNPFTEQGYEQRNQNATAWISKILNIGGRTGVPAYMFKKINEALCSQSIKNEGRRIEKGNGEDWSMEDSKSRSLYNGEIGIIDYNFQDQITDDRGTVILVWTEPSTPYWIYKAGFQQKTIIQAGQYITSTSDRNDLITELNTIYADYWGLTGVFAFDTDGVYYTNGVGENYTALDAIVLTEYFDIDITIGNIGDSFSINLIPNGLDIYGGVSWGDGVNYNFFQFGGVASTKTISRTYTTATDYTVRIFPVQTLGGISIIRSAHQAVINNVTGDMPTGLNSFNMLCNSADFVGLASGLDLSFLASAKQNITQFGITGAGFTAFNGNVFASNPATGFSGNSSYWRYLNAISFYRCAITSSEVEGFIEGAYDFTPKQTPMYMDMRQIPAAPVTNPPATTYKTNWNNSGSTIITD